MGISMRSHARLLPLAALWLLPSACTPPLSKVDHHWFGMDTDFSATLYVRDRAAAREDSAFVRLERESARLENVFSDYLPGSSLKKLQGRKGDTLAADPEIVEVFRAAEEMAAASRGRFDITLHNLKTAWGLASGDSNKVPSEAELAAAMRENPAFGAPPESNPADAPAFRLLPGNRLVLLRDSVVFDLGGIAKGYAVDRMHALLDSLGFPDHIVTAGGDLRVGGAKRSGKGAKGNEPWMLGIRHPRHPGALAGTITLPAPEAVSTSGDYERFFIKDGVRYHHIFDPRTGKPARPYCSVTVLAGNSLLADRLTKPLFILGPEAGADLLRRFGARAVWMREVGGGADDGSGQPRLCYVPSAGMPGLLDMKEIEPCGEGR
ncbi:MAG TPA: FAD:protein FMN transferase [Fibrobacteria bacterium]|nr:FAD:protein FMN transferase [Fibrobacteria bacterium]